MGALRRFMVDTEFYIKRRLGVSFKAFYGRHGVLHQEASGWEL